jgi:PAS domain S-box-containing protein
LERKDKLTATVRRKQSHPDIPKAGKPITPHGSYAAGDFLESVMNNVADGIVISSKKRIMFVNKGFLNVYGLDDGSNISRQSLEKYIHPEEEERVKTNLARWFKEENEVSTYFEYRIIRPDGLIRVLVVSMQRIDCGGQRVSLALIRDITEMKAAREKIKRLNNEIGIMRFRYNDVIKSLEAITESVCHDLRLPLVVIERLTQKLQGEYAPFLDQKFEELTDVIGGQITSMNKLIDSALAYKQLLGKDINRVMVSVKDVVQSVMDATFAAYGDNRTVILSFGRLPPIYGDETMLRQVFANLISNAFKFTKYKETALIEVGALDKPHEVIYYVRDNGEGFDMQSKHRLFNAFQRLHNAERFEGTGIGLAIVKRIIKQHGGRVWAESKVGHGASFYFALPKTL